ncbi:MAG: hypothetical protein DYG98_10345 [Haliscomenobacteraceae bacterium CHB4]|nr:hypothetical protein [Saprospiraceae bacterium]MCE7923447.1 hypothetical protein [Haliscomenobacteraceae bacterium CHB4]
MKKYPAKLLLFGEHVLLLGASALSVPVPAFSGHWDQASPKADVRGLQMRLSEFAVAGLWEEIPGVDVEQMKKDLRLGLFFRSDIPVGYGLGSSGALCAAVYDRYCRAKTPDMAQLKSLFSRMESFFHGSSSGIDPLTSYLNKPLLIRNKTDISIARTVEWGEGRPYVFLLDTRMPRQTGPLVQWFLEQSADAVFLETLKTDLFPAHEAMVQAWLEARADAFWPYLQRVSRFQLDHFRPMIPSAIQDLWKKSLDNADFTLKVCGAGGGGFVLGFAPKRQTVEQLSEEFRLLMPFDS